MTAIVGVLCRDGVVVASDSSATFGTPFGRSIEQETRKIRLIPDGSCIACGAGSVGLIQRFCHAVELSKVADFPAMHPMDIGRAVVLSAQKEFHSTRASTDSFGAVLAFPSILGPQLCEFSGEPMQFEFKTKDLWYVSLGCVQIVLDSFLGLTREVFWTEGQPMIQEAIFAASWAIDHAIRVNPGGVNGPIEIATLATRDGILSASLLSRDDTLEHEQAIEEAKSALRSWRQSFSATAKAIPDNPI